MVKLENLCFGYGEQTLFRDANLFLAPGKIYGLLGLNGAGKSTLLRLMAGLLFPDLGRANILGYAPARREPGFLSKLFLLPEELNVPSVADREFVTARAPFYPEFNHERMERLLGAFDVPRGKILTRLSQGQKKKFLLSFGLASNASLLMLDEPTNGLDIPSKGLFRRLIAEALTNQQVIVTATHQVRDVDSLIDSIIILHKGKVLLNRGVAEMSTNIRTSSGTSRAEEGTGELLYRESTVGGFATVRKERNEGGGQLDLELLFKAAIASPDSFSSALGMKQ